MAPASSWFSENPERARTERFFLLYSPIWMAIVGFVMLTGVYRRFDDLGYMAFGIGVSAPLLLGPLLRPHAEERSVPVHQRHWFRAHLWIFASVWIGSYFFSHYFFDIMGMRYGFPTTWNLDAAVVGSDKGQVPLFLYPLTQAYFITYFTVMTLVLRRLTRRFGLGGVGRLIVVLVLSYATAFAETLFMAIPALDDVFIYLDKWRMLVWGSMFYAFIFIPALPLYAGLDERTDEPRPPLWRILLEPLGAAMVTFMLMDAWAMVLGPLAE